MTLLTKYEQKWGSHYIYTCSPNIYSFPDQKDGKAHVSRKKCERQRSFLNFNKYTSISVWFLCSIKMLKN